MTQERLFYEFGPFRIERGERLLRRGEQAVPLPPKTLDLLLVLVEGGGEVVDKERLLERVWPGTFVEEGSLAHHVSLLRRTLGETAAGRGRGRESCTGGYVNQQAVHPAYRHPPSTSRRRCH
jgi:DNA-binding winged helix-turn-helix (wHTH) protein